MDKNFDDEIFKEIMSDTEKFKLVLKIAAPLLNKMNFDREKFFRENNLCEDQYMENPVKNPILEDK